MRTLKEYIKVKASQNRSEGYENPLDLFRYDGRSCDAEISLETAAKIYSPYYIE